MREGLELRNSFFSSCIVICLLVDFQVARWITTYIVIPDGKLLRECNDKSEALSARRY